MANRWFIDTEFCEDGRTIDLISIALVNEAGDKALYFVLTDGWYTFRCNEFVLQNVVSKLPPKSDPCWMSRAEVAERIKQEVGNAPEFWGYYAGYDWVALCQLFGRMVDLPEGWPMYCRDFKQLIDELGVRIKELPEQECHSALADAKWLQESWNEMWNYLNLTLACMRST
jgi:hypothetical protein